MSGEYLIGDDINLNEVRDRYLAAASYIADRQSRIFPLQQHPSRRVRSNAIAILNQCKEMIEGSVTRAHDIEILRLVEVDKRESKLWGTAAEEMRARLARTITWGANLTLEKTPDGVPFAGHNYHISMNDILGTLETKTETKTMSLELVECETIEITDEDLDVTERMLDLSMELERYDAVIRMAEDCIDLVKLLRSDPLGLGGVPDTAHAPAIALCLIPHASVEVFL